MLTGQRLLRPVGLRVSAALRVTEHSRARALLCRLDRQTQATTLVHQIFGGYLRSRGKWGHLSTPPDASLGWSVTREPWTSRHLATGLPSTGHLLGPLLTSEWGSLEQSTTCRVLGLL